MRVACIIPFTPFSENNNELSYVEHCYYAVEIIKYYRSRVVSMEINKSNDTARHMHNEKSKVYIYRIFALFVLVSLLSSE